MNDSIIIIEIVWFAFVTIGAFFGIIEFLNQRKLRKELRKQFEEENSKEV